MQLTKIAGYLQSLGALENAHPEFKNMVKQYHIQSWPKYISLIFATDDISQHIKSYIRMIHDGITKEQYDQYAFRMSRSDLVYQEFMANDEINSTTKHQVRHSKTLDELRAILSHENVHKYSGAMLELIPSYITLKPCFDLFHGHIGYAHFNNLVFPRLVPPGAIKQYWE
jgi:L-rhamnose mutarotase